MNPCQSFPKRRAVAAVLLVVTSIVLSDPTGVRAQAAERPNIIYILADDLGYGDLGSYGQKTLGTPNLDRLAAEGMRFTDHYAGSTVCRPSRLVLLTGYHTGHTPISSNAKYWLTPEDLTVTELLKKAGYATGGIGKWALGIPDSTGMPHKQHFDLWFGYLDQGEAHNYYPEHLWRNDEKVLLEGNILGDKPRVSVKRTAYSHDLMTEAALEFIRHHARGPFCLQAHYTIPHANNEGGRATGNGMEVPDYGIYADRDWPDTEKGFAAMIARLDRDVSRMIALLRELGIEEKTLVLFTSDNGPHQEGGHQLEFFDSNGPLRGYKRDLYEGGIRVPMIAWWPGQIEPGSVSDHVSAFWDFLPTACELAGIDPPDGIDGISFVPELLGKEQAKHEYLYWQYRGKEAVRKGPWKAVRLGPEKPIELYRLDTDLGEQHDVAKEHPDAAAELEKLMQEARSPR
jgi:uncharacterized sulfatase